MADRPFAEVLDQALSERGLALERVVDHLKRRGVSCSISTLSLWRRGRTRPSLARSGAVLHTLESVLDLERDVLVDALAVPRPESPAGGTSRPPSVSWPTRTGRTPRLGRSWGSACRTRSTGCTCTW